MAFASGVLTGYAAAQAMRRIKKKRAGRIHESNGLGEPTCGYVIPSVGRLGPPCLRKRAFRGWSSGWNQVSGRAERMLCGWVRAKRGSARREREVQETNISFSKEGPEGNEWGRKAKALGV